MSLTYAPGPIEGVDDITHACFPPAGVVHKYLWWATQTTDAPPWFHVGAALAAVACEAARRGFTIGEMQERPRVWTAFVAPSGVGKSTAINMARKFYNKAKGETGSTTRFLTADGTTQGIFESIAERHDKTTEVTAVVLTREEFSALLNPKRRDDLVLALCEWADGNFHERHLVSHRAARARGESVFDHMKNPAISACFATTEESLISVATTSHLEGGLFSRLLWFTAKADPTRAKMHLTPHPKEESVVLGEWFDWFKWLDSVDALGEGKNIQVSRDVQVLLETTLFESYKQSLDSPDRLTASRKRGLLQAYIIAALFALSQKRLFVISEDMDAAVNLVERCINSLSALEPEIGVSSIMRTTNTAFRVIAHAGAAGVPRAKLYPTLRVPKQVLDQVLQTLLDEGSIVEVPQTKKGPGRPATRFCATSEKRFEGPPPSDGTPENGEGAPSGTVIRFPVARSERNG